MHADSQSAVHREREAIAAYPSTLTFHDLIRRNRRNSALLMWAMALLGVLVGAAVAALIVGWSGGGAEALVPSAILGAVVALVLALIGCAWSWFSGADAILRMSGARPIEKADDPVLFNIVDELRLAGGMPMPRVYLIEDPALNAFATGRDPQHAAVAITRGLRERLTRDELAGVMAHEMAHVRHLDIRFAMLMATLVGLIVFACDAGLRTLWYSGGRGVRRSGGKGGSSGAAVAVVMVLALLLAIVAPLLAKLLQLAVSRQREYLADAGAVELTRYPEGLASALRKLGESHLPLRRANRATAHLYIVNPFRAQAKGGHAKSNIFSTHPPLETRIARLMALAR